MTTEPTQTEKREALARWVGWTQIEGAQRRWLSPSGGAMSYSGLPDYWNDGNAMLRLLARIEVEGWEWERIQGFDDAYKFDIYTPSDVYEALVPDSLKFPAAVAEACWEAIQ